MHQNNEPVRVLMTDIQIYKSRKLRKSYVVPGRKEVEKGQDIIWETQKSSALFFFPKPEIFKKAKNIHPVKKGGKLKLKISKEAQEGEYPYAVYTDNDDFAEGGSFPRIIIR